VTDAASYRWMRVLAVVAVLVVVTAAFQSHPRPGVHGFSLAVSACLAVLAIGTIAVLRAPEAGPRIMLPLLVLVVISASTLVGLQTNGPGFLGVFPAVSVAALRLRAPSAVTVAVVAGCALAVAWAVNGNHPVDGVVLNEMAVVAFFLLAIFARRLQEGNERSQQLIAQLETTRAAQAEAAALGERQRLAREMHDVLAHSLSGLVLNLEGARLLADRNHADPKLAEAIRRSHRLAKTGLEEARRAIGMLRDDALPGQDRLGELTADYQAATGVACSFRVLGVPHDLDSDSRLTIYRVGQEAITNIRKHACPERVEMTLEYQGEGASLTIEDFETTKHQSLEGGGTGYGLTGMRERAELLGGTLSAGPTPTGFRVDLWVP
jgi:signal transduction histidine kinase